MKLLRKIEKSAAKSVLFFCRMRTKADKSGHGRHGGRSRFRITQRDRCPGPGTGRLSLGGRFVSPDRKPRDKPRHSTTSDKGRPRSNLAKPETAGKNRKRSGPLRAALIFVAELFTRQPRRERVHVPHHVMGYNWTYPTLFSNARPTMEQATAKAENHSRPWPKHCTNKAKENSTKNAIFRPKSDVFA